MKLNKKEEGSGNKMYLFYFSQRFFLINYMQLLYGFSFSFRVQKSAGCFCWCLVTMNCCSWKQLCEDSYLRAAYVTEVTVSVPGCWCCVCWRGNRTVCHHCSIRSSAAAARSRDCRCAPLLRDTPAPPPPSAPENDTDCGPTPRGTASLNTHTQRKMYTLIMKQSNIQYLY